MMNTMNAATAAAMLAFAGAAAADSFFATNHMYPGNTPDTLIRFDPAQPHGFVTLGPLTAENIGFGGLEFDGEGRLWAYATFNKFTGGATSGLYSVNTTTGAATLQGTRSPQTLTDLAFNPVTGVMHGVYTQGLLTSRLYSVNLSTGAVTVIGTFSGLPSSHNIVGLAISSSGEIFVFDNYNRTVYRAGATLAVTPVYTFSEVFVGSQGITIDWRHGNVGYHAAVGQGAFPNYFSQLNSFDLAGGSYAWGPGFGPNYPDGLPPVQAGDIAIAPGEACYANCDGSTAEPSLNVADFTCFLQRFAAGDSYANCDDSTVPPVLNVADFTCFLQRFAAGCR